MLIVVWGKSKGNGGGGLKDAVKLAMLLPASDTMSYGREQTNNDYYNAHAYSKHVQHIYTISVTQSHVCISPVTTLICT